MPKCFCGNEMTRKDWKHQWVCHKCGRTKPLYESMTNADRIRSMSDEELAIFLSDYAYDNDENDMCTVLAWLESEAGCE